MALCFLIVIAFACRKDNHRLSGSCIANQTTFLIRIDSLLIDDHIANIDIDEEGSIYIQQGNCYVTKFDENGVFVDSFLMGVAGCK